MIKEEKKITEQTIHHVYCDFCHEEIHTRYSSSKCTMCERHVCHKCTAHEDEYGGDYNPIYCNPCHLLGETPRKLLEYCENEMSRIINEWRSKCKENAEREMNGKIL